MSDYDLSIHTNPDAVAWAKFFMKTMEEKEIVIDEGLMIAWFANAMMAMHDHLKGAPINGDHAEYLLEQEAKKRDHITDGTPCWCNPETTYISPETGGEVIVHKEQQ